MKRFAAKHFTVLVLFFAALCTLLLGILGASALRAAYRQEISTVQNLADAVLSEYPQAETAFLQALQRENGPLPQKNSILKKYGYTLEMRIVENPRYQRLQLLYLGGLGLFLLLFSSGFLLLRAAREKDRSVREDTIVSVLDQYFSGDYSFLKDTARQDALENPHFSDTLVRLGQNLRSRTEALEEERDYTKTLVTDISHQLKTPIAALKTCFALYLEADTPEEREEFLSRSMLQMDKLEALTSSLIHISRLETAMITLHREPVKLRDILAGAVSGIYHKAAEKNIAVETADFEDLTLNLDKKWTIEALINLLDNAVKYSPAASAILLRIHPLFSFVRIDITDQGIGIPEEDWNKLFQRFWRGTNETVKNTEGTGVGLYLTRKILEEQGGTVNVTSQAGKGSTFTVQLPL